MSSRRAERYGGTDGSNHARGRRDAFGVQFLELGDVIEDGGELAAVGFEFFVRQFEPGEVGDVGDFLEGEGHDVRNE